MNIRAPHTHGIFTRNRIESSLPFSTTTTTPSPIYSSVLATRLPRSESPQDLGHGTALGDEAGSQTSWLFIRRHGRSDKFPGIRRKSPFSLMLVLKVEFYAPDGESYKWSASHLCLHSEGETVSGRKVTLWMFLFLLKSVLGITFLCIHLTQDPWLLIIFSNIGLWKYLSFSKPLVKNGQLTFYWLC